MSHPRVTKLLTKSTLVTVSHAIEQAALAAAEDGPALVLALFQRLPYFERERQVYERIAARCAVTVIGLVAGQSPELPAGAHAVLLDESEPYAREWTVVVLTPRFGAVLVAHDREQVSGSAATLEAGRLFDGWWSLRRDDALHEALRLRGAFADRLPPAVRDGLDDVVAHVRDLPAGAGESRTDALTRMLIERLERGGEQMSVLRRQAAAPAGAAVTSDEDVRRWSGVAGVTASGTLAVALLAIRVPATARLPEQAGRRTAALRDEGLIPILNGALRDTDRLSRFGDGDFLILMPAIGFSDAVKAAHRLHADLVAASARNPFLPGTAHLVVMVTRQRPFPTDRLREALDWAQQQQVPVAQLPDDPPA